ncbi:MAG: ABC transporter permease, partial [Anaerolineales bacterium]
MDESVSARLLRQAQNESFTSRADWQDRYEWTQARHEELLQENGYYQPFLEKHLRWTKNALTLQLGDAIHTPLRAVYVLREQRDDIRNILLDRFPNTLMLVGLADLLVFVIGIPLSLYLSRHYGGWFDKLLNLLSPLSSVPSWVHGVLLILVFAVTLRMLPPGGMVDIPIPDTRQGILASRLEHMILPVLAIFLSLLFQLVYSWRNYFMIYSNEDYVDLAIAKGLAPSVVQNKYILQPSLPYVITSFALTLVGFWQMATALEVVFNWDGIGSLYITSLPNFWGESMFPGEVGLTIGIVVVFAYLLGFVVLMLDVAYAIVDPRIRLGGQDRRVQAIKYKRRRIKLQAKPLLTIIGGLLLGLFAGAMVGWGVWPVQYVNAAPSDLHPNFQTDYAEMIVDSFAVNQNSVKATHRLNALEEDAAPSFERLTVEAESDPELKANLQNFALNFRPDIAAQVNYTEWQDPDQPSLGSRLGMAVLIVVMAAALTGGSVYLYLWLTNRPPKKEKAQRQPKIPLRNRRSRLVIVLQEMMRYPSAIV